MLTQTQIDILGRDIRSNSQFNGFISQGNDQGIADVYNVLNNSYIKVVPQIPISEILGWAATGPFASIYDVSVNTGHPLRAAALTAIHIFGTVSFIDSSLPSTENLLRAFLQGGVISSGDYNAFLALQYIGPATSGEVLFGAGAIIDNGDISMALRGYR